jgi:hypothetical protein
LSIIALPSPLTRGKSQKKESREELMSGKTVVGKRLVNWLLVAAAAGLLLSLYVGSYVLLSLGGRYESASIGLGGVKNYGWAPRGFVDDFVWDRSLMRVYFPLYQLDVRCWHTYADADSGKYPINEVAPEDIGRVYQAWDALR